MVATKEQVRTALMETSTSRIPDSVITARLTWATAQIDAKKKSGATTANVDQAIIDLCAYDVFSRYIAQYRNSVSSTTNADTGMPMQVDANEANRMLANLEETKKGLKEAAEQSASLVITGSLFQTTYTVIAPVGGLGRNMAYIDNLNE